ncbi:uncharacterized protein FOMMEDRAFT_25782 [Fomitiporia mediterranea MF3/22]|uniref:uncharacterized protein n=1 Tax=Fomitiporia mediterranea (strain MF3/22) TaxID=694068 RepID=UPI000440856B|nr:uncharacterized protein FOMMEDRAFT_25782 [Fomitiporia mediterranea MF3/22]EJD06528.1 hypothetical protein FOMMEDRAFT_25782 [Fomitiporia mediterranea MF3/22]
MPEFWIERVQITQTMPERTYRNWVPTVEIMLQSLSAEGVRGHSVSYSRNERIINFYRTVELVGTIEVWGTIDFSVLTKNLRDLGLQTESDRIRDKAVGQRCSAVCTARRTYHGCLRTPNVPQSKSQAAVPTRKPAAVPTTGPSISRSATAPPAALTATKSVQTDVADESSKVVRTYRYHVQLDNGELPKRIENMLTESKHEGIELFDVSPEKKTVEVTGTIESEALTRKLEVMGIEIESKEELTAFAPVAEEQAAHPTGAA